MDRIYQADPEAWARILVVLQEAKTCPRMRAKLLDHEARTNGVEVKKWLDQYNKKPWRNLWRLKVWEPGEEYEDLLPYRVVYGYTTPRSSCPDGGFTALAVVHRDEFDYERDSPLSKRIQADYDDLF